VCLSSFFWDFEGVSAPLPRGGGNLPLLSCRHSPLFPFFFLSPQIGRHSFPIISCYFLRGHVLPRSFSLLSFAYCFVAFFFYFFPAQVGNPTLLHSFPKLWPLFFSGTKKHPLGAHSVPRIGPIPPQATGRTRHCDLPWFSLPPWLPLQFPPRPPKELISSTTVS